MAEAHLIAANKAAIVQADSNKRSKALSVAIEMASNQKSAVAKLANELYEKSSLISATSNGVTSLLISTQAAKQTANETADALYNTSSAKKSDMTNTTQSLVTSLLN